MRIRAVCLGIAFLALCATGLRADSLILGDPPMLGTGNCDPFGCPGFLGLGTYQQVYLSSAFPEEISIAGLTFFEGQVLNNGGVPSGGTFTLTFSYTPFGPGSLNLTNPNANIGAGSQTFFSGTLPPLTPAGPGKELIIAGTPFVYNPADGNLLLTITVTNPANFGPALYLNEAQCGPKTFCPPGSSVVSGSAYFGATNGGNVYGGLVTGFDYSQIGQVPEPVSALLLMSGMVAIVFRARARSRS